MMDETAEKPTEEPGGETEKKSPVTETDATDDDVLDGDQTETPEEPRPDPTRFGDWEKNGRCIDF
jgi:hypothetical protein